MSSPSSARGSRISRAGARFEYLYTILRGSFKASVATSRGEEQVTGFYLPGAMLGLDALGTGRHAASLVATEDSEVCLVAARHLEQRCASAPQTALRVRGELAREIDARRRLMVVLGCKTAEERVASFLVELASSYVALGQSTQNMSLVLKRREIGSYLGITQETVSRVLSGLHDRGVIRLVQKRVSLLDADGLARLTGDVKPPAG